MFGACGSRRRCAEAMGGLGDETFDPNTPACPEPGHFQSMLPPWFYPSTGVGMSHHTGFWGSICPLVHQMRRKKIARKINSPQVRSLPRCGRFTLCYGMNPRRATHRKTTQILSLSMFERIHGVSDFTTSAPMTCRRFRLVS